MVEMLRQELEKYQLFDNKLPKFLLDLSHSIPNSKVPERMKLTINKTAIYLIPSNLLYSLISISMAAVNITRRNQAATSLLEVKP